MPAMVPVKSRGTYGNNQQGVSGVVSASCRYCAGISGWHIPALQKDHCLLLLLDQFKRSNVSKAPVRSLTLGCLGLLSPYGTTENFPWGGAHAASVDADACFGLLPLLLLLLLLLLVLVLVLMPLVLLVRLLLSLNPTMRTSAYPACFFARANGSVA